jgi:hypothetical protein
MKGTNKEKHLIGLIGKHAATIDMHLKQMDINAHFSQKSIDAHLRQMIALVAELKQHEKNRIAAHKAHTTMAKRRKP